MKKYLVICFASAFLLGGCAVEAVDTVPADETVVAGDPPFSGAVWIGPEYTWTGTAYVAVPGHWDHPHGRWEAGHWNHTRRGYHWVRGRWR